MALELALEEGCELSSEPLSGELWLSEEAGSEDDMGIDEDMSSFLQEVSASKKQADNINASVRFILKYSLSSVKFLCVAVLMQHRFRLIFPLF